MTAEAHLYDVGAIRLHLSALREFAAAGGEAVTRSLGVLGRALDECDRAVAKWASERARAQSEVAAAEAALERCLAAIPRIDCSGPSRALATAEARLGKAEENLGTCERCRASLRTEAERFRHEATAFRLGVERQSAGAVAFLNGLVGAADAYLAAGAGGGAGGFGSAGPGGGSGIGGGSGTSSSVAVSRIGQTEMEEVELDRVDLSQSAVEGPASYRKADYATVREGIQRLDEVVLPAVRRGEGVGYFRNLDAQKGLSYERGYQRVYEAFFGDDSLRLDLRPNGTFGVTNGYHRIHLANELGLRTLPARVARPPEGR
ncbi:MAG TPA: hypothetical protein VK471_05630 [Solirubrobacterales bacterium]|nr:hypothetical protein [Solirubrobacterales bacterium]